MSTAAISSGQPVKLEGASYTVVKEIDTDLWQLENKVTGRLRNESLQSLHKLYMRSELYFQTDDSNIYRDDSKKESVNTILDTLTKKQKKETKLRYAYVSEIKKEKLAIFTEQTLNPLIERVTRRLKCHRKKPNWHTVYRWWVRFSGSGYDIRSIVKQNKKKGNHTPRYPVELLEIVKKSVENIFLTRERNTIQDTLDNAIAEVKKENALRPLPVKLPLPTRRMVKTAVSMIPEFDKCVARYGRQSALVKFRAVLNEISAEKILDRVEIDHTRLDLFVLDDESMLPLGRPWLTACIDVRSRNILGIYIGFAPPSHLSVARCLREAILPKTDLHEKYPNIQNDWICYGVMGVLVVDNGMEFHGDGLEELCACLGIIIQYTPRKMPWFKGVIERFLQTFNGGVSHGNPGTTFHNFLEKDDYDSANNAIITLSTLQEIARLWVVDYYHQKPHSSLGVTPNDAWLEDVPSVQIRLPSNPNDLDYMLGRVTKRDVTHKGVGMNTLFYNSRELQAMRMKHGDVLKKVKIRYDDGDLGRIYVLDPKTSEAICVPAIKYEYAKGLSLWQHKVCKRYAKKILKRTDIEALAEAKERIRDLISRDFFKKKTKSRSKMKRFMGDSTGDENKQDHIQLKEKEVKSRDLFDEVLEVKQTSHVIMNRSAKVLDSEIVNRH